jgi:hypothetical protein
MSTTAAPRMPPREGSRIAERQHQCSRVVRKHEVKQGRLFSERPGDKAAAHPPVASRGKFSFEPGLFSVTATDQRETTRLAHCASEAAASNAAHRRQQDWMSNTKFSVSRVRSATALFSAIRS